MRRIIDRGTDLPHRARAGTEPPIKTRSTSFRPRFNMGNPVQFVVSYTEKRKLEIGNWKMGNLNWLFFRIMPPPVSNFKFPVSIFQFPFTLDKPTLRSAQAEWRANRYKCLFQASRDPPVQWHETPPAWKVRGRAVQCQPCGWNLPEVWKLIEECHPNFWRGTQLHSAPGTGSVLLPDPEWGGSKSWEVRQPAPLQ